MIPRFSTPQQVTNIKIQFYGKDKIKLLKQ
jgi:hypothetical protein